MANFIPFQQSALFSNIAGGGGQPLGAVPMDFATATPYQWNTNPITTEPEVPENNFDMEVFCSIPANANHPMCSNAGKEDSDYQKRMEKESKRDYFSIEDMKNLDDESLINYLKDGWIGNSRIGYLPSKGDIVTVNKPLINSPLLQLVSGKQQELRRKFIIDELTKRGFVQGTDKDGNVTFNINPQLYKKNLNEAVKKMIIRQDDEGDIVPVVQNDGTVEMERVDRTGGDYYQKTKPTKSHLTKKDGKRDENKYKEALRKNIVRSVKNTNPQIRSRYSKSLGGFTGGR